MKKRNQKNKWIDIVHFDNEDNIPTRVKNQILALDDKLASLISGYCRRLCRPGLHTLRQWNQLWTKNYSNLVLLVVKPSRYSDVIWSDIKVVGYLHYTKDLDSATNKTSIYISDMWVEPEFRRKHWASSMVRSVFDKYPGAYFEVSVMNMNETANDFWNSMGFVTPIYTNYMYQDPVNDISEEVE